MSFKDAVTTVFTQKYADFSGRARRSEYWFASLAVFLVSIVLSIVDQVIGMPILGLVFTLAILIPGIAVAVRRLHDTGRSGWWLLLGLIPFGGFVVLYWLVSDSSPAANEYGPSPKGTEAFSGYQA